MSREVKRDEHPAPGQLSRPLHEMVREYVAGAFQHRRKARFYGVGLSNSSNATTVDFTPAVTDGSGRILNNGE